MAAEPLLDWRDINEDSPKASKQSAEQNLFTKCAGTAPNANSCPSNKQLVHKLVQDSQQKCTDFTDSLFAETAGTNVVLDLMGTISSALGTVFTPIAVTHSFSAASTIFGSAKTSISADYLNTLSISHITQAIQTTYGTKMQDYITFLTTAPDTIDPREQRTTIASYHALCSLSAAEGSIASTLQPSTASATTSPISFVEAVTSDTATDVAAKLAKDITADAAFSAAGLSAEIDPSDATTVKFMMKTAFSLVETTKTTNKATVAAINVKSSPPTLTISKSHIGDTITITGTPSTSESSSPAAAQPAAGVAGAAIKPASK